MARKIFFKVFGRNLNSRAVHLKHANLFAWTLVSVGIRHGDLETRVVFGPGRFPTFEFRAPATFAAQMHAIRMS